MWHEGAWGWDSPVLKITLENGLRPETLKLSGKVAGPWVRELRQAWDEVIGRYPTKPVQVDLGEVGYVDPEGRHLLASMFEEGAVFVNARLLTKYILEQVESSAGRRRSEKET